MNMVLLMAAASFLLAFSGAEARIITHTGKCAGGTGEWIIIVTIDDSTGRVTRLEGENCYGEHWVGHCGGPGGSTSRTGNTAIGGRMAIPADRRDNPAPGGRTIP